ncbi:calcium-binding protein [Pseudomonadota bacterium]
MAMFRQLITVLVGSVLMMFFNTAAVAQESLCAVVKIEIKQELTLERQAFDAHMRISNALDTLTMENVAITVNFTDENDQPVLATSDTSSTDAAFFIRVDSMEGISDIEGAGVVQPASTVDVHWLIVPAPGSGGDLSDGKLYFVGARLTYTLGGEEEVTEVAPDFIRVKPMPLLSLDYFLTEDVVADDPFTTAIEQAEPFTLGVRIRNDGKGPARSVKIESAQPKIIENKQGLLIGFEIVSGTINDAPSTPSLLVDFGDISPGDSTVGRWQMLTTLAGRFTEFTADFVHVDEFGGELTSLIDATNAHLLIHDVLVDLPGRDGVTDFLAQDGMGVRVFESDSVDTEVNDYSATASFSLDSQGGGDVIYNLDFTPTLGAAYVQLSDPHEGEKEIHAVLRSDGKLVSSHNAWLSKRRNKDMNSWDYFINLFDVSTTGAYSVHLGNYSGGARSPVLQFVTDRTTHEGKQVSFIVEASDPDGTTPVLTAVPLPEGAGYIDQGDGTAIFDWTPNIGQAGSYLITFIASDGALEASRTALIRVNPAGDTDGDGMDDAWEMTHFGDLSRDGTGDYDGDGISDLDEFLNDTNPVVRDTLSQPLIDVPTDQSEVLTRQPLLGVVNSSRVDPAAVSYLFEVYADAAMIQLVASSSLVAETLDITRWQVDAALDDNSEYHWRARADNGFGVSEWVNGSFFVNTVNDAPSAFQLTTPVDAATVTSLTPVLTVNNAQDVDRDAVNYLFRIFADVGLGQLVSESGSVTAGTGGSTSWTVTPALNEDLHYYWQVTAVDEHGTETVSGSYDFFVSTVNDAPLSPSLLVPVDGAEVVTLGVELVIGNGSDPEGDPLSYAFELDTVNTFDGSLKRMSGSVTEGLNSTSWSVAQLEDNTQYYWRAKASDGTAESAWIQGSFFVNTVNDLPPLPTVSNPGHLAWVETLTPSLVVNPAVDIDGDSVQYRFELYDNALLAGVPDSVFNAEGRWLIATALNDNSWYFWRVRSEDEHGAVSDWSSASGFFVNDNGTDDAPFITLIEPAAAITADSVIIRWQDSDPDSSALIALYFSSDNLGGDGTLIIDGLEEDLDGDGDSYDWDLSGMAAGTYYVYARISDGFSESQVYAAGSVTVAPSLPSGSVSVTPPVNAVTTEVGGQIQFSVVLDSVPTANVLIPVQSSNSVKGNASVTELLFTPDNWNIGQTVTVTGNNDCGVDVDTGYSIVLGATQSADDRYNAVSVDDVLLVNADNDSPSSHSEMQICGYVLVSSARVTRVDFDYTYRIELKNSGLNDYLGGVATLNSSSSAMVLVENQLNIDTMSADEQAITTDTITIRINRLYPFDPAALSWDIP